MPKMDLGGSKSATKSGPPSLDSVIQKAAENGLRVGSLGSASAVAVEVVSTGNLAIDSITGCGGLPVGRSIELYGPPSSGKTTTALQAAAHMQRRIIDENSGEYVAYFDYEHATDPSYCAKLGLDLYHPSFLFAQPDTFEQGAEVIRELVATGLLRMFTVDSVASMTPSIYLEGEGSNQPGVQARLMSQFMKALNSEIHRNRTVAVFLNHEMEVIDMGGRGTYKRTTTPGGKALKFYSSLRLSYQQVANHKGKLRDPLLDTEVDGVVSTDVRIRVVKNKLAPPFREALVRVRESRGFDEFWSAVQVLKARKLIPVSGAYYYFDKLPDLAHPDMAVGETKNQRPYIQGEAALLRFADARREWRQLVIGEARRVLNGSGEPQKDPAALTEPETPAGPSTVSEDQVARVVPHDVTETDAQDPGPPSATESVETVTEPYDETEKKTPQVISVT